jgi:hypothetical protein
VTIFALGLVPPPNVCTPHGPNSINGRIDGRAWRAGPGGQPNSESSDTRHRSEGVRHPGLLPMPRSVEGAGSRRESALLHGRHPQGLVGWLTAGSTPDSLSHGQRWRKPMVGSLRRKLEFGRSERGRHGLCHRQNPIATSTSDCDCASPCRVWIVGSLGAKPLSNMKIPVLDAAEIAECGFQQCSTGCTRWLARPPELQLPCRWRPYAAEKYRQLGRF